MKKRWGLYIEALAVVALVSTIVATKALASADVDLTQFTPSTDRADTQAIELNEKQVELGEMLYFDVRLSKSGVINCNSCHDFVNGDIVYGYIDNSSRGVEPGWQNVSDSAPKVYSSALHIRQSRTAHAVGVEERAVAMGATGDIVIKRVATMQDYKTLFEGAFPGESDALREENVVVAIAAFESTRVAR